MREALGPTIAQTNNPTVSCSRHVIPLLSSQDLRVKSTPSWALFSLQRLSPLERPIKPHLSSTLPGSCSLASPLLLSDLQPGWYPLQGLHTLHPCPALTALTPEVSIPFLRQAHTFTPSTCLLLREKAWCFQPQGLRAHLECRGMLIGVGCACNHS